MGYDTQFAIVYALALTLYAALWVWALPTIVATARALIQRVWFAALVSARSERTPPQTESMASMLASTASSRLRRAPDRRRPTAKLWLGVSHDRG